MRIREIKRNCAKYLALTAAVCSVPRVLNFCRNLTAYFTRRSRVDAMPFILQIEPTNRCDLHCRLCATGAGELKRPKGDMSFSMFKNIIDPLRRDLIYLVLYNLGEPTLNPELYEMIEYAKKNRIFVRLSTNAYFTDPGHIKKLISSGVDEIVISLDCATESTYAEYKGGADFNRVLNNVRLLVKERGQRSGPFINLQLLIMRNTESEIDEFKKIVRESGVDKGIMKKVRVDLLSRPPKYDFLPKNEKYIRNVYKKEDRTKMCWRPWFSTLIFWDGTVVPCCLDMAGGFSMGNVTEEPFSLIWNKKNYVVFREKIVKYLNAPLICAKCSIRDFGSNFVK